MGGGGRETDLSLQRQTMRNCPKELQKRQKDVIVFRNVDDREN